MSSNANELVELMAAIHRHTIAINTSKEMLKQANSSDVENYIRRNAAHSLAEYLIDRNLLDRTVVPYSLPVGSRVDVFSLLTLTQDQLIEVVTRAYELGLSGWIAGREKPKKAVDGHD